MTSVITGPKSPTDPTTPPRTRVSATSRRRSVSSRVYLPALSIVAVAIVLVAIGLSSHWGGSSLVASMTNLRVVVVGPVTVAILVLFLVIERLRPAQRRSFYARGYRQDVLYTVLNATLV